MTTIAIKDGVIAADGLKTAGGMIRSTSYNKIKVIPSLGWAIAGCGLMQDVLAWHAWLQAGGNPDNKPELKDFYGLSLSHDGSVLMYEERLVPATIEEPFIALGYGQEAAMAAMHMGASATEAVEMATKLSVWSGGTIRSISTDELKGRMM